jgi:hypothetical protein
MDRVAQILRMLCRRALDAHDDPPTLTGIVITGASARFGPRLRAEFSNGYHTWAAFSPGAFFAFCERHAVWDIETLHTILLNEGREVYARSAYAQVQQRVHAAHRPTSGRGELIEVDGDDQRSALSDEIRSPQEYAAQRSAAQRNLRQRWGEWWTALGAVRMPRVRPLVSSREAAARGDRLLQANLTQEQRQQYEGSRYFEVTGGETGRRYRIRHSSQMNVEPLDQEGKPECLLCFAPKGDLVVGDIMLAQKIALELFESEALAVANKMRAGPTT